MYSHRRFIYRGMRIYAVKGKVVFRWKMNMFAIKGRYVWGASKAKESNSHKPLKLISISGDVWVECCVQLRQTLSLI